MAPWVHLVPPTSYTQYVSAGYVTAQEQGPGLRALFPLRVGPGNNVTSVTLLLHLRSVSPGHPDRLWSIRGKCWIASRAPWSRAGQAQRAWPGHPSGPRPGETEVYPSDPRIGTRKTRFSVIRHQTKQRVFLSFLRIRQNPEKSTFPSKARSGPHSNQRDAGSGKCPDPALFPAIWDMCRKPALSWIPGRTDHEGSLAPPESELFPETAENTGKGWFQGTGFRPDPDQRQRGQS